MKRYEELTIEILMLSSEDDIITTSSPFNGKDHEIEEDNGDW